jgi:fumarylacetoacetase
VYTVNETHDPTRRSWVASANDPESDFPVQNLPFGVLVPPGADGPRLGVAIGEAVLDLPRVAEAGLLEALPAAITAALRRPTLNALMALGPQAWSPLRARLSDLLREGGSTVAAEREALSRCLHDRREMEMRLPADIGDYTDFYASVHHATNVGRMLRPDAPLLPNYKHVPIGYHGRASSCVVSGTPVTRPRGQSRPDGSEGPVFGPSRRLDYELEVGFFIGPGNALGTPLGVEEAEARLFGVCLVNDWSARDLQQWEYQPLGPFLSKSFATTVSPWIVTLEALAPFRAPIAQRPAGDPAPLAYLDAPWLGERGAIDLALEVWLTTAAMRDAGAPGHRVSRSNLRDLYWSPAQLVAHHASNGCNLRPGDLLASGTVSGPEPEARGCLLERAWRGTEPIELPSGERRAFLEDGDEVVFRGRCVRGGAVAIGFGECRGRLEPARKER